MKKADLGNRGVKVSVCFSYQVIGRIVEDAVTLCAANFGMRKMTEVGIFVFPERICIGGKDTGGATDIFGTCSTAKCTNAPSFSSFVGYLVFHPSSHRID